MAAACSSPPPGESWEARVGRRVEIEGEAENRKMGAAVGELWVDGEIPEGMNGKQVRVAGTLTRRDDLPVFVPDPKAPPKAGMPVPEGTDLEKARRRYVITKPTWTLLDPNPPNAPPEPPSKQ
jgi:hypothetical protein